MNQDQGDHFPTIELDRAFAAMRSGSRGDESPPRMIGPYAIIGVLGEGGMGIVYEAEQQNPRRRVALKMIHQAFASDAALRRFMREPEILARLEHPGIARIYEAGAIKSDGVTRPYFAMELVRGVDIKTYAKSQKLGTSQRLELLAKVADAVDFAHENGVVHRDLKPANILVDDDGQPRILDFGVARLTQADKPAATLQTSTRFGSALSTSRERTVCRMADVVSSSGD